MTIYLVINVDHLHAFDLLDNAKDRVKEIIDKEYSYQEFEIDEMDKRIDWIGEKDDEVISIHFLELNKKVKK